MEEDVPIEHRWTTKAIENAQRKVEGHNYDIRKHLLEYDDVMNQQRKVVYAWRKEVLARGNLRDMVFNMVEEVATNISQDFFPGGKLRKDDGQPGLNVKELNDALTTTFQTPAQVTEHEIDPFNDQGLKKLIIQFAERIYSTKEKALGDTIVRQLEKMILLTTIDHLWKDHLLAMDHLREGIGLQGYGQKDPLIAYKKEGFRFFQMMMDQITGDVIRKLFAVQMAPQEAEFEEEFAMEEPEMQYNLTADGSLVPAGPAAPSRPQRDPMAAAQAEENRGLDLSRMMKQPRQMTFSRGPMESALGGAPVPQPASGTLGGVAKVGRNDPCPCGSGKKYKKCHGT
jgi:preprotein translocase subunit SecA